MNYDLSGGLNDKNNILLSGLGLNFSTSIRGNLPIYIENFVFL